MIGIQSLYRGFAVKRNASRPMSMYGNTSSLGGSDGRRANTVLAVFPSLGPNHFVFGEPAWLMSFRYGLYLAFAGSIAYQMMPALHMALPLEFQLSIAVATVIVGALLAGQVVPRSIDFIGDSEGVYFPSRTRSGIGLRRSPKTWLFVPWSNVIRISVQPLFDEWGSTEGVTYCLRASEAERREYFSSSAMPDLDSSPFAIQRGSFVVGYRSAFRSPYKALANLLRLQNARTSA